jgi:hypothetical protein
MNSRRERVADVDRSAFCFPLAVGKQEGKDSPRGARFGQLPVLVLAGDQPFSGLTMLIIGKARRTSYMAIYLGAPLTVMLFTTVRAPHDFARRVAASLCCKTLVEPSQ